MRIPATAAALLIAGGSVMPAAVAAADARLSPFTAQYAVKYSSLSVGGTRFELRRDSVADRWVFESRANASGFARLFASGTLVQTTWIEIDGASVRPLRFRFDDGMQRSDEDIALDFDWGAGRVTGRAKGKPVDLPAVPGLQDPVSIQVATMVALLAGREPGDVPMVDGPKIKTYRYRFERRERIESDAGSWETVVYTSSRDGSTRVTWMWLAPELDYLPVQVEQQREGKRLFAMYLQQHSATR